MKNTKFIAIAGVVIVIIFFIGLVTSSAKTVPTDSRTPNPTSQEQSSQTEVSAPNYEIVKVDPRATVTNYSVLVAAGTDAKGVAEDVKKKCTDKPCNISVYDDRKALELDEQYKTLSTSGEMEAWKKQHYVYVADHLLGWIDFSTGTYQEYPNKDWYYKELKGE